MADARSGQAELEPEFGEVVAAHVPKFDPLQIIPDAFLRVQLRGVGGQLFQPNAGGTALGQEILDEVRPVDGCSIPDDQQRGDELELLDAAGLDPLFSSSRASAAAGFPAQPPGIVATAAVRPYWRPAPADARRAPFAARSGRCYDARQQPSRRR